MARSSRLASKYVSPQWRSENCAIRNDDRSLRRRPGGRPRPSVRWCRCRRESPVFQAYCGTDPPRFANRIEVECAKILDYYGVPWDYEPQSFVLERDDEGRVVSAFTPDFYLPEQNLYVEVTVMKQSLVTRKNRKLRELRRLYPHVRVKLFYRRDIERLAQRYRLRLASCGTRARLRERRGRRRHLTRGEIAARVAELGQAIGREYDGLDPILVAPLKSSVVFLADLSRALRIPHTLDMIELAPYTDGQDGGVRLLKDLDSPLAGRHVLLVEDVVDTGLTLNFLCRTLGLRRPASLAAVTLLDRPTAASSTTCRFASSASPCRTSCSPATGSVSTSAGGRSPTSTSSARSPAPARGDRAPRSAHRYRAGRRRRR